MPSRMGIRHLFSRPPPSKPSPWQANLPCVHSPADGCTHHNPHHSPIHFDPHLLPKNTNRDAPPAQRQPHQPAPRSAREPPQELFSALPRTPASGSLALLPHVHQTVPYSLAFYHVHGVMAQLRGGVRPQLSRLACAGMTGAGVRWVITPVISGGVLMLEYALAFAAEGGDWDVRACAHVRMGVKGGRARFERRVMGRREEWREGKEVEAVCCERCYTDAGLRLRTDGVVEVRIYKDLGQGLHPDDPKWSAAAKGVDLKRDTKDFGRMKGRFQELRAPEEERTGFDEAD
ncbi:hypothetical protein B0H67DRAFT_572704 [Lasiosphaeris hirsuta]|uniref:Uncharacterized protein n=1 Tax=Lasiosphaeris hirsuta TaxID=260670 RepID=A0AA40DZB1_9PEZI|nr:hypothetical protein B0H67DRAFT_572704 [Lasiosphaeris hirsuta]